MLTDTEAEVCLYIAADTTKARSLWSDCVRDFYQVVSPSTLRRLRTIWVPADVNLDREGDRALIRELIANELATDVLLNIVLGNLTATSVEQFAHSTGSIGLDLAVLFVIATEGFRNIPQLAVRLGRSATSLRERLTRLVGCGYLTLASPRASFYYASLRGRVFLELCGELHRQQLSHPEMQRILRLLGMTTDLDATPTDVGKGILRRIDDAVGAYHIELTNTSYHQYWESEAWPPMVPRPSGFHDS